MTAEVTPLRTQMTDAQFNAELAKLRAVYGTNKHEAGVRFEQELAKLAKRSRKSHDWLAYKLNKSQPYISRLVLFGAFLNFMPVGMNSENTMNSLSERRFRDYWQRTNADDEENKRFQQVVELIRKHPDGFGLPQGAAGKIRELFADGKWHSDRNIHEKLGVSNEALGRVLKELCSHRVGNWGMRTERKPVGTGWHYRFYRKEVNAIGATELADKLGPIIKALKAEGRKNAATASPPTVAKLATDLERVLNEWMGKGPRDD